MEANNIRIVEKPLSRPTANQVVVKMIASPIGHLDIEQMSGKSRTSPAILGNEGVGVVVEVGSGVKHLQDGDHVVPAIAGIGTWRTAGVFDESSWLKVSKEPDVLQTALMGSATLAAYVMLHQFSKLRPGDVIIQNAANGVVGSVVVQIAASRKVQTINIVRERDGNVHADIVERIKALGGNIVVPETFAKGPDFAEMLKDLKPPSLALNAVGGSAVNELIRVIRPGGKIVSYANMSGRPVTFAANALIEKEISLTGFNLVEWASRHSREHKEEILKEISEMTLQREILTYSETWPFSKFQFALDAAKYPQRTRRIILQMDK